MAASRRLLFQRIAVEALISIVALLLALWAWRADAFWFEQHANAYRCIRTTHTLSLGNVARWCAALTSVLMLMVLRPKIGRRVGRLGMSGAAIARITIAIVLALGCSELFLRRPVPMGIAPEGYSPAHLPDPRLAWKLDPGKQHTWHAGGRDFVYAVNDEGNRAPTIHSNSDHAKPTIFTGGESIVMGMGLPYEDAFPAVLEERTGVQVVDLGVDAYGIDQTYMRDSDVIPGYAHPLAIITLFHPEVAERSEVEDRPRLRDDGKGGVTLIPEPPNWVREIRLRHLLHELYHSNDEVADMRGVVRGIAALARNRGAYPLFVTVNFLDPCLDVKGAPPWLFRTLFEDQNVPHIHVFLPANERISDDLHPGALAHKRMADAVEKALRDARVL